jgi:uncharacterized protein with ACT and thioredoxin-like domain
MYFQRRFKTMRFVISKNDFYQIYFSFSLKQDYEKNVIIIGGGGMRARMSYLKASR